MNRIKTFIAVRHYLTAHGLMHYIHQIMPEPDVEIVDVSYLLENRSAKPCVLLIDPDKFVPNTLEKVRHNFRECKIVAISEGINQKGMEDYFVENILINEAEEIFLQKLRGIYNHTAENADYSSDNALSQREKEILREVAFGKSNKEIAEKLFISPNTVITHRKNITAKLGIKSIAGLTIYAVLNSIISIDEIEL